jgi:hypothetical protein
MKYIRINYPSKYKFCSTHICRLEKLLLKCPYYKKWYIDSRESLSNYYGTYNRKRQNKPKIPLKLQKYQISKETMGNKIGTFHFLISNYTIKLY